MLGPLNLAINETNCFLVGPSSDMRDWIYPVSRDLLGARGLKLSGPCCGRSGADMTPHVRGDTDGRS